MPNGDRTGPMGNGAKTGRALGYCVGNEQPGYMSNARGFRGGGRFRAQGRGQGRGMGPGYVNQGQSYELLEKMKETLESMDKRLGKLEKE